MVPNPTDAKTARMADVFERPRVMDFTPPPAVAVRLQLAPLIDVVLLLVCFYLLVSEVIRGRGDAGVALAAMARAATPAEAPAEVIVNLRADGSIAVNGRAVALADLPGVLGGPVRVVLRADRRQSFARLEEVLGVCRKAGLEKVIFRARGPGQP